MRLNETVITRDQSDFLSMLVHTEWLDNVIAGHNENYKDWQQFAAWLILKCTMPEPRNGNLA